MNAVSAASSGALQVVLSRLEAVKPYGPGYRARCPACGGRSQKLSVTEADPGRVLLHCFAGCEAAAVVQAIGLQLADLFPARLEDQSPAARKASCQRLREASWGAALEVLAVESMVILIAARHVARGKPLPSEDCKRLMDGVRRVADAQQVLRPARRTWRPSHEG